MVVELHALRHALAAHIDDDVALRQLGRVARAHDVGVGEARRTVQQRASEHLIAVEGAVLYEHRARQGRKRRGRGGVSGAGGAWDRLRRPRGG